MKRKFVKITGLVLLVVMMISVFAGCGGNEVTRPVAVQAKTDLQDAVFTFTYGQLRQVLPGDKLARVFEQTNKKTDDKTIKLTYYELMSQFGSEEYFDDIMKLVSAEDLAKLTANQQQVLDYFNAHINDIKATGEPKVSYSENFWIDHNKESVTFKDKEGNLLDGQDVLRAAFKIYSDAALKNIGDFLMNRSQDDALEYGSDLKDVMYIIGSEKASLLTLDDLYSENGTYPIHSSVVPTLTHDLDEDGKNAEDEDGEYIFVPTELYRTIIMTVKPEEESVKKAFTVREKDKIMEQMKTAEGYMTVNSFEIGFNPCKITAGINAVTDNMTYVTYEKNMVITANVTFTGALSKYGDVVVEFPCTSSLTYNFGWNTAE